MSLIINNLGFQLRKLLKISVNLKISNFNHFNQKSKFFSTKMSSKSKVYVTRQINNEALELLSENCQVMTWTGPDPVPRAELLKNCQDKEGLFCLLTDKIDKELLDNCPNLKVIATMSVGYDHLDVNEIRRRGIRIGYTPDILTDATAELTVALLLATSRRLLEANNEAKLGKWKAWSPFWMCGPGLAGATVGMVGFGRIGQEVAKRLKPFGIKELLYLSRTEKKFDSWAKKVTFDQLLKQSDFIVVTCTLNEQTQNLFTYEIFKKMKPNVVFINTSRGGVVNQEDLVKSLKNGTIWAAGLDVMTPEPLPTSHELFQLKNCVILPHIGSACKQTRDDMAILTVRNILAALKGETMPAELSF